jgi:hypothetical protein
MNAGWLDHRPDRGRARWSQSASSDALFGLGSVAWWPETRSRRRARERTSAGDRSTSRSAPTRRGSVATTPNPSVSARNAMPKRLLRERLEIAVQQVGSGSAARSTHGTNATMPTLRRRARHRRYERNRRRARSEPARAARSIGARAARSRARARQQQPARHIVLPGRPGAPLGRWRAEPERTRRHLQASARPGRSLRTVCRAAPEPRDGRDHDRSPAADLASPESTALSAARTRIAVGGFATGSLKRANLRWRNVERRLRPASRSRA